MCNALQKILANSKVYHEFSFKNIFFCIIKTSYNKKKIKNKKKLNWIELKNILGKKDSIIEEKLNKINKIISVKRCMSSAAGCCIGFTYWNVRTL